MTHEEIIYEYYLNSCVKQREAAIEILAKRDFVSLRISSVHWYNVKEKVVELKSTLVSEAIKELATIKHEINETEPHLECSIKEYHDEGQFGRDTESNIVISSYLYTIVPYEKCESLAKSYTSTALWKIKYQPNGKDTKRYLEIIESKLKQ
jgi:hypothetical protein